MGGVELRQDCVLRWRPGRSVSLGRCPDTEKAGSVGGGGSAESRSRGVVVGFWWGPAPLHPPCMLSVHHSPYCSPQAR